MGISAETPEPIIDKSSLERRLDELRAFVMAQTGEYKPTPLPTEVRE